MYRAAIAVAARTSSAGSSDSSASPWTWTNAYGGPAARGPAVLGAGQFVHGQEASVFGRGGSGLVQCAGEPERADPPPGRDVQDVVLLRGLGVLVDVELDDAGLVPVLLGGRLQ